MTTQALCGAFLAGFFAVAHAAFAAEPTWTATLRAGDILVGQDLAKISSRRWLWEFKDGKFEVAVRRSAIPVAAPKCRSEYLILTMPVYYPENPAQAPMAERKAVYDALGALKKSGQGSLRIRFDAPGLWRKGPSGAELTACNIFFTLPLDKDASRTLP